MTAVCGSCSQKQSRSLPLTSSLLPSETKLEMPVPPRRARSERTMPTAPDCEPRAMRPRCGGARAKVAWRWTEGSAL